MDTTTDLEQIEVTPQHYTWGEVIEVHTIGQYSFVEYHPWETRGSIILSGQPNYGARAFGAYIDGRSISRSYDSLDAALVGVVGYRHDGTNSQAAGYFMKMIGAEK